MNGPPPPQQFQQQPQWDQGQPQQQQQQSPQQQAPQQGGGPSAGAAAPAADGTEVRITRPVTGTIVLVPANAARAAPNAASHLPYSPYAAPAACALRVLRHLWELLPLLCRRPDLHAIATCSAACPDHPIHFRGHCGLLPPMPAESISRPIVSSRHQGGPFTCAAVVAHGRDVLPQPGPGGAPIRAGGRQG